MNEAKKIAADLDITLTELDCGINALDAVHVAMTAGGSEANAYADALYCVRLYLEERSEAMSSLLQQMMGRTAK